MMILFRLGRKPSSVLLLAAASNPAYFYDLRMMMVHSYVCHQIICDRSSIALALQVLASTVDLEIYV